MTRPIDADILKEAINTWDKFACLPNGILEPFRNLEHPEMFEPYIHFRDVIKAIDNVPTIPLPDFKEGYKQAILDGKTNYSRPQEWIPVNERLPEIGQVVIVTDDRAMVFEYKLDQSNMDKYTSGKWRFLDHKIIAWQPLPEPYKKEAKE